jgi:hypothetical protein
MLLFYYVKSLNELKLKHKGQDIYVIGSGPSLNYISNTLLEDKTVICINHSVDYVKAKNVYVVSKEPSKELQKKAKDKEALLVTCEYRSGDSKEKNVILFPENTIVFKAKKHSELEPFKELNVLTSTASTVTTALHLAGYMGAKAILLIGHDCGMVDGKVHVEDYNKSDAVTPTNNYEEWMYVNGVEQHTLKIKRVLEKLWNIPVHSINPFINFGLEDHEYERF